MSSQNCSSETPPNDSVGHSSSSTSDPLRQPTRRRDLVVLTVSSVSFASASARCRAAARRPGTGITDVTDVSGVSSRRSPCRARRPVTAGSESSRTGCGPVKSITVLAPARSASRPPPDPADPTGPADAAALAGRSDRADLSALAERSGLAERSDRPEDGGEVLLFLLAGTRLSAAGPGPPARTREPPGLILK